MPFLFHRYNGKITCSRTGSQIWLYQIPKATFTLLPAKAGHPQDIHVHSSIQGEGGLKEACPTRHELCVSNTALNHVPGEVPTILPSTLLSS